MSTNDPTAPPPSPPIQDSKSVMNPILVSNVSILGGYILVAMVIICATVLAAIHDGAYTEQTFQLFTWVGVASGLGAPVTAVAHTILKRNGV